MLVDSTQCKKLILEMPSPYDEIRNRDITGTRAALVSNPALISVVDEVGLAPSSDMIAREINGFMKTDGRDICNASVQDGRTPLIFAAYEGHLDAVRLLNDKGADTDATDLVCFKVASAHAKQGTCPRSLPATGSHMK